MPTLIQDTITTSVTMWLAYCSNKIRTVLECVSKTQATVDNAGIDDKETVADWISKQITTACLNRGTDIAFISGLFDIDNARLALGCVEAALDIHMRGIVDVDIQPYLDRYTHRYGESSAFLTLKLRWLTLYPNYTSNIDEVERIMTVLIPKIEVA